MEATEGGILIDGVDLSKVGLADLRSRLSELLTPFPNPGQMLIDFAAIIPRQYLRLCRWELLP